eukprot:CAMPEP_0176048848 /NCGR_PEP_ID=MMETSP0120_2-20121206/24268_1 /TAXON_ID=160619 /ORGANISM="Kryptoperidinium foliaceum, Strain CCMP 1326" /LENGTH=444 /DNA_ID=CAMNT_0017382269 /DNA_START=75 /DNA_END=1409 /DNA_ORIENTATION=+
MAPVGPATTSTEHAMVEFVCPESFQKALQGQGMHAIQQIGRRLESQRHLLEKAHQKVLAEQQVLLRENAELNARIAEVIRELSHQERGSTDLVSGFDLGRILSYFAEPCIVEPPVSPTVSVPGSPTASQKLGQSKMPGRSMRRAPSLRSGEIDPQSPAARLQQQPQREVAAGRGNEEASVGVAEIGKVVGRQLSDAWTAISHGELFDLQCSRVSGKCCAVDPFHLAERTGSTEISGPNHDEGSPLSLSARSDVASDALSGDDRPFAASCDRGGGFKVHGVELPRTSPASCTMAPLDPESSMRQLRRSPSSSPMTGARSGRSAKMGQQKSTKSMRSVRSVQIDEEPVIVAPAESDTVLIEANLQMDGVFVGLCHVRASDDCSEVAARFIAENSLKLCFEAPLAEYLQSLEEECDEFPALVSAELSELRRQHRMAQQAGARARVAS